MSSSSLPSPSRLPLRRRSKRLVDDLSKNHVKNTSSSSISSTEKSSGDQPLHSLADGSSHNNDVTPSASKERSSHAGGLLKVKKEIQGGKTTPSSSTHSNSSSTTKRAGGGGSEVSFSPAVRASLSSPLVSHSSPASATLLSPRSSSRLSVEEEEHDTDNPRRKKEMTIPQDPHRPSRVLRVRRKEEEEGGRRRKSEEEKEAEEASLLSQQEEEEDEVDKNIDDSLSFRSHKEGHVDDASQNTSGSHSGGSSLRRRTRTSLSSLDSTGRSVVDDKWADLQRSHASSSSISSHIPPHATHRQTPPGGGSEREGRTTAAARGTGDTLSKRSVHANKLGTGGESGAAGGGGGTASSSSSSVFVENALAITQLTELLGWDWEVEEEGTDERIWTLLAAIPVPRPRPRYV